MGHVEELGFGAWIKQRRKALDMTQRELGIRASCSAETVQKIEAGALKPSRQLAELLAESLEIASEERETFVRLARGVAPDVEVQTYTLPPEPTLFIGREREVAAVSALLRRPDVRLLTLTGPPGIGKTRLSLRVSTEVAGDFSDGVYFVPLAPISEPGLVLSTIAQTLGVREVAGQLLPEVMSGYLRDRRVLLVLDNFEQVVAVGAQVAQLVMQAPGVKALVSSREVLHVYGGHDFPVPPMTLPGAGQVPSLELLSEYEAVHLFVERAQAVRPDFSLTAENAGAVIEVCRTLDALPLAIELATTRINVLTPQSMLTKLDNRLALLVGGGQNLPPRQQTLRAAIDWSYDLLSEEEKTLFRRLAVFVGGCTLEAASDIELRISDFEVAEGRREIRNSQLAIPRLLDTLGSLVGKGLLRLVEAGTESRFSMMETIREYALEKLEGSDEAGAVRRGHALFFVQLTEQAEPELPRGEQGGWLDRLEREHDNLRAALRWLLDEGEGERAARLAGALWWFWYARAYFTEGRRWLEQIVERYTELPAGVKGKVLQGIAVLAWSQGDYDASAEAASESLALRRGIEDKAGIAGSLNLLGAVALQRGRNAEAAQLFAETLALRRELGDEQGIALSLSNLGLVALNEGEHERAESLLNECLALRRKVQYRHGVAQALNDLGVVMRCREEYVRADALHRESLAISRELGHKDGMALSLHRLGLVAMQQDDLAKAESLFKESLLLYKELGIRQGVAGCLEGLARVRAQMRELHLAAMLWGAANELRDVTGTPVPRPELADYEAGIASARAAMGQAIFAGAWTEGEHMEWHEAVELALNQINGD
ncbi:MAG TPA: tetratricopeptide repeat protein [Chloroflexia bacterium]|nr:tetratricopeptide repeat protein [Chloroflexia bacterium]